MIRMNMRRPWRAVVAASILLIVLLGIPWSFGPPGGTRMILDHTNDTYIAPPCFDQAGATNYLTESTWANARESGYAPESTCTEAAMEPAYDTLWNKLWQSAGFLPSRWSW